ncbi:hypothetical protein ABK040_010655 [Willaertia magna]
MLTRTIILSVIACTLCFFLLLTSNNSQVNAIKVVKKQQLKAGDYHCPPGSFYVETFQHKCEPCYPGNYCPGNDKIYTCANGTVAIDAGMIACTPCESKRTNSQRTVCVLVNTPAEAREVRDDRHEGDTFDVISASNPYWYTTLVYGESNKLMQYTFVDSNKKRNTPVVVYASTVTGKPTKDNHMYMAIGQNATLNMPVPKDNKPVILYINVVPLEVESAKFFGKSWEYLAETYQFTTNTFTVSTLGGLGKFSHNDALFVYHSVPAHSKVNFTISVEEHLSNRELSYKLYYSTLKSINYPNCNNADVVVESPVSRFARTSLVVEDAKEGPFAVTMTIPPEFKVKINVWVTVTPQ